MTKRVLIVGSGIVGASLAWHLSGGEADVTVLDGGDGGGLATRASFAWINASWGNPEPYFRLRERAMLEWRTLDRAVPGLSVNWCGGLIWDLPPAELDLFASTHAAWGYGIRRVSGSEIRQIEPNLTVVPDYAYHVAEEGAVEPLATARCLLAGARGRGVRLLEHTRARWLLDEHEAVAGVMTDEGPLHADETVIAAGAGSVQLLQSVGIGLKLTAPPGLLTFSAPAGELLRGLVMTPELHVRQTAEGRLVAGADFSGADPLDRADEVAAGLHAKVQKLVRGAGQLALEGHTTGYRPTPADGFPAIGRPRNRKGLYVAVTHSGITLAPIIGAFGADEILNDRRDPLLQPYHPDRPALQP